MQEEGGALPGIAYTLRAGLSERIDAGLQAGIPTGADVKINPVRGSFDLAINPSWMESFGMAAMEVLAAGVPLLSTRSGVIDQVLRDERYLVKPRDAGEMQAKLLALAAGWPGSALDVAACQRRLRERFPVERSAQKLAQAYAALLPRQHRPESLADPRLAE